MMYQIKGSPLSVNDKGEVFKNGELFTSEYIRIDNHTYRVRALILNVFIEQGRLDLIKLLEKPIYLITNPKGGKYWTVNLSEFCADMGLDYERMKKAAQLGHITRCKWTVDLIR